MTAADTRGTALHLRPAALSDVGRVRTENQDSGYAGAWLLAICDGVGGAARGDIASSTAIRALAPLDAGPAEPESGDPAVRLSGRLAAALDVAQDEIGAQVVEDPTLVGTSTTATVALFDGARLAIGHVGDSRAYLLRRDPTGQGAITQLTKDHTFVQTLIDEGRITEEEARYHPHRNLILRALDGIHEADPDLFVVDVHAGDRLLLCSDGVCGVLDDGRLGDLLAKGAPEDAARLLVTSSLDAGSTDNVTAVVADVTDEAVEAVPVIVGAAAEKRRPRTRKVRKTALGSTDPDSGMAPEPGEPPEGDTAPVDAPITAAVPPEGAVEADPDLPRLSSGVPPASEIERYAPRPPRGRIAVRWIAGAVVAAVVVIGALWAGWSWNRSQWFVGVDEGSGTVAVYRGTNTTLAGIDLFSLFDTSALKVADLPPLYADQIRDGIPRDSLAEAEAKIEELAELARTSTATDGTGVTP